MEQLPEILIRCRLHVAAGGKLKAALKGCSKNFIKCIDEFGGVWYRTVEAPRGAKELQMSERQKNRLLAVYLILVNAGAQVSDSMKKAVEKIENERMAERVAKA